MLWPRVSQQVALCWALCAGCLGSRSTFGWHLVFLVAVELASVSLPYRVSIIPLILEINSVGVHVKCWCSGNKHTVLDRTALCPQQGLPPVVCPTSLLQPPGDKRVTRLNGVRVKGGFTGDLSPCWGHWVWSAWHFPVTFPRRGFPTSVPVLQS